MARSTAFMEAVREAWVAARPDERYTDKALADRAGVTDTTVRRWRNQGAIPDLASLIGVADAVDITILEALMALQGRKVVPQRDGVERIADELMLLRETLAHAGAPTDAARDALVATGLAQTDPAPVPVEDPASAPAESSRQGRSAEDTPPG